MNMSSATRWGLNLSILLSVTMALYLGQTIFIPLIISLLLAAMLWPTASWMNQSGLPIFWLFTKRGFPWLSPGIARVRVSWGFACLFVITAMVVLVLLLIAAFGLGLSKIIVDAANPTTQEYVYKDFVRKLQTVNPHLDPKDPYFNVDPAESQVMQSIKGFFRPESEAFRVLVGQTAGHGLRFLWQSVLIMFILLFLLLEGRMLSRRFVEIFGSGAQVQGRAVEALKDMAYQIRAYLVWRTIINFGVAGFLGLLYYLLELKLPWTWALLTAILWYIPYLGAIAAGVPPVLDAFISVSNPWSAVTILILYTVIVVIEGYIIVPVVMGRSMEMNATTVMLACLFWELVWGSPGLFLAMPLMAAVKTVCHHVPEWRPWANLMSSNEPSPEDQRPHEVLSGQQDTEMHRATPERLPVTPER